MFAIPRKNNPIDNDLMREILGLKGTGIEVYQMPTFFKRITGRIPVEFIEESWLVFSQGFIPALAGPAARIRRLLDVVISLGALTLFAPLIVAHATKLAEARGAQPVPIGITPHNLRHTFA